MLETASEEGASKDKGASSKHGRGLADCRNQAQDMSKGRMVLDVQGKTSISSTALSFKESGSYRPVIGTVSLNR